jgi:hypothetical protein
MPEQSSIEWQAPEYEHRDKHPDWFWVVGIVGSAVALLALLFKNFLLAVIFILGAFTMILYGARPPAIINFALTPKGVRVKDHLYSYDYLKSFWVDDEKGEGKRKIIVESKKVLMPHIILPLAPEVHSDEARHYLAVFLPEERHEDSLADVIGDVLGF